jgi:photosystem II stability/assembly factor-like uncharacterized protein
MKALSEEVEALEERPGESWNYQSAYRYWMQQHGFTRGVANLRAFERALSQRSVMPRVNFVDDKHNALLPEDGEALRWHFLGPKKLPVPPERQYHGAGTTSGRVNGLAFDPNNPNVIYLASAGGGFWKSEDGGKDWDCLSDDWENVKFSRVVVHPHDSNFIIVGTGDYDRGRGWLGYGYGLMITRTGGVARDGHPAWEPALQAELRWSSVTQILFDPDDPQIITVTAGRHPYGGGLMYRSEDGGLSWERVSDAADDRTDWRNVEVGVANAQGKRYYYAVGVSSRTDTCSPGEIRISKDNGKQWKPLPGLPLPGKPADEQPMGECLKNIDVAPSATDPETVYVMTQEYQDLITANSPAIGRLWTWNNATNTWSKVTTTFPLQNLNDPLYNWEQTDYDFYLKCVKHPGGNKDLLFVGLKDLLVSTDGGTNWQAISETSSTDPKTHTDQHALAVNPHNPAEFLVGNDGGVYGLSYKRDAQGNESWSFRDNLNDDLEITMFYRIAVDPSDPGWMIGGTQDNATPVRRGKTDEWTTEGKWDGGFCAINPNPLNKGVQYLTLQYLVIYRTGDFWTKSEDISYRVGPPNKEVYWNNETRGFIAPVTLDPNNPDILYVGTQYLWRRDDSRQGNQAWTPRLGNRQMAWNDDYINFIAVAPKHSERIYVGTTAGTLWMTRNGGVSWEEIGHRGLPGGIPYAAVTSIAVHPQNPDRILVGFGGSGSSSHIWRCNNTGARETRWIPVGGTGENALPSISLNAIALDPDTPDTKYYVGTDLGTFLTNDGGATWANFGNPYGLPNIEVTDLHMMPGRRLVAATYGRGAWSIDLAEGVEPLYLKPSPLRSPRPAHPQPNRKER